MSIQVFHAPDYPPDIARLFDSLTRVCAGESPVNVLNAALQLLALSVLRCTDQYGYQDPYALVDRTIELFEEAVQVNYGMARPPADAVAVKPM